MPAVWLVTFLLCASYTFNMSFYYFTPYATKVFGATAVLGAVLTVLAQDRRPVAATTAGFLGDRFGKSRLLMGGFSVMALGTLAVILIPTTAVMVPALIVACVVIYLAMYSNYGLSMPFWRRARSRWKSPVWRSGSSPPSATFRKCSVLPSPASCSTNIRAPAGFRIYFSGMVCVGLVGAVLAYAWLRNWVRNQAGLQRQLARSRSGSR